MLWVGEKHLMNEMYIMCCLRFTGGRRFSEGTSADREIQRTLMEVSQAYQDLNTLLLISNKNRQYNNFSPILKWLCPTFWIRITVTFKVALIVTGEIGSPHFTHHPLRQRWASEAPCPGIIWCCNTPSPTNDAECQTQRRWVPFL